MQRAAELKQLMIRKMLALNSKSSKAKKTTELQLQSESDRTPKEQSSLVQKDQGKEIAQQQIKIDSIRIQKLQQLIGDLKSVEEVSGRSPKTEPKEEIFTFKPEIMKVTE